MNLILSPRYTDDSRLLRNAALRRGWDVHRVTDWRAPGVEGGVTMYGESIFVAAMCDQLGLELLEPSPDFLVQQPEDFVGRSIEHCTYREARLSKRHGFYKPANHKVFKAGVYKSGADLPVDVDEAEDVLISDVVDFHVEFRGFVRDRTLKTLTPYIEDGELAKNADDEFEASVEEIAGANRFFERFLADPESSLPDAVVIDVGQLTDARWVLVEANTAPESGLCAADPDAVLDVISVCFSPVGS